MKIGIMQPYFFPYIGYFQLINSVDKFVIFDDVQYINRGWINRNNILVSGMGNVITIPIKKHSLNSNINKCILGDAAEETCKKILETIKRNYKKAQYFEKVFPMLEEVITINKKIDVSTYNYNSLKVICNYLKIDTEFLLSSEIEKDEKLVATDKIIDIVKILNGKVYINPIGGINLYSQERFRNENIKLRFIEMDNIQYHQFNNEFIPNLSIIDAMMFNNVEEIQKMLNQYKLITN